MSKDPEDIGIREYFLIVIQSNPRFLRAVSVPIREAEEDELGGRVIGEEQQQGYRYEQECKYDDIFLSVVGHSPEHSLNPFFPRLMIESKMDYRHR
ncbi:hypothetical protein D3C73_1110050 [compost metagenome]